MYGGSGTWPAASMAASGSSAHSSTMNVSPASVRAPTTRNGRPSVVDQLLPARQPPGRADEALPATVLVVERLQQ